MTLLVPETTLEFRQRRVEFRLVRDGKKKEGKVLADVMMYEKIDDFRTAFSADAFNKSLAHHLPKMLWGHNFLEPIGQWIDADNNRTRLRMLGQLDLDRDEETRHPLVPMAHRAWYQLENRTVDQWSVGFVRLQDEPHREVRGAKRITEAWLDEASPVVVGSVPGTGTVSTRSGVSSLTNYVQERGERRRVFNMETRANPQGFNQYKHMTGGGGASSASRVGSASNPIETDSFDSADFEDMASDWRMSGEDGVVNFNTGSTKVDYKSGDKVAIKSSDGEVWDGEVVGDPYKVDASSPDTGGWNINVAPIARRS